MNELELLRRVQNLEREIKQMRAHSHGQYEIGMKSLQIIEVATGYQGLAIRTTAHVNVVAGNVVCWLQGASGANSQVDLVPASSEMPIGSVVADASAGAECWVVVAGYGLLLPMALVTAGRGYVAYTSATEAGRVNQSNKGEATAEHWRECGHFITSGTGAGVATLATLHFN